MLLWGRGLHDVARSKHTESGVDAYPKGISKSEKSKIPYVCMHKKEKRTFFYEWTCLTPHRSEEIGMESPGIGDTLKVRIGASRKKIVRTRS